GPGGQGFPDEVGGAPVPGRRGQRDDAADRGARTAGLPRQGSEGRGRAGIRQAVAARAAGRRDGHQLRAGGADGAAGGGGERRGQDDVDRQAGQQVHEGRQEGDGGGMRHLPGSGGGAVDDLEPAAGLRDREEQAGQRSGGGGARRLRGGEVAR